MLEARHALDILLDQAALSEWAGAHRLSPREARRELLALAQPYMDEPLPELKPTRPASSHTPCGGNTRTDAEALCAFVDRWPGIRGRMRQVFDLCIVEGLSLTECGERLGISRETVRVHLRRLRHLMRRYEAPR